MTSANIFKKVCNVCYRFRECLRCFLAFSQRFVVFASVSMEVCDVCGVFTGVCCVC